MGSNGQPSGILGELLAEIARQESWVLRPQVCEWQACLDALQAGELDLMPDVAYSEERAALFDFHKVPSLHSWSQIYKRKGVSINSVLELQGKRIAVLDGSVQQDYLQNVASSFGIRLELVPVPSLEQGFALTRDAKVDGAAANRFYGDRQAAEFHLESTPILFQPAQLFYASAKGRNADLHATIDRYLKAWESNPESPYQAVLRRWMDVPPQFSIPWYIGWVLGGLGLLLLSALGLNVLLRREVTRQTGKLKASEDRLATILNSVDAYIYIKDTQLRYQYANRKVCELFGLPIEQVIGRK